MQSLFDSLYMELLTPMPLHYLVLFDFSIMNLVFQIRMQHDFLLQQWDVWRLCRRVSEKLVW